MIRMLVQVAAIGALSLGMTTGATAQTVHWTGRAYNVSACAKPAGHLGMRCHVRLVSDGQGRPLGRRAVTQTYVDGYGPAELRSAYNIKSMGLSSTTVAVVDAYGYSGAEADLATYRTNFGLPQCSTENGCFAKYNQNGVQGDYPTDNLGWSQETALDLAMVSAMCPNCRIILVEANAANAQDLAAAENQAAALGAHVISNSYGGEETGTKSFASAFDHPGVAITASTGDEGYGAQFPASAPTVIAVGGTSLNTSTNSRGWSESAWSDGGSGCSALYAKPVWQTDPLCTMRMIADVAAVADPDTGVAVYAPIDSTTSAWLVAGGTSVSAPLIAGIYGVNGKVVTPGAPYDRKLAGSIRDIIAGSNGVCGGTYFCKAGRGYDGPTGLGTPNGATAF